MANSISSRAQDGFAQSSLYDTHRPTYPAAVVSLILDQVRAAIIKNISLHAIRRDVAGMEILDLAAGTGKFTSALAIQPENEVARIWAVEPHADMRAVLAAKRLPRVTVYDGTAEKMESIATRSVDAVIVAQSFHWFEPTAALREIHRVLRPKGLLVLLWNGEDYNAPLSHQARTPALARLQALNFSVADESGDEEPRFRHMKWKQAFDGIEKGGGLGVPPAAEGLFELPLHEHLEPFTHRLDAEALWRRFATLGHIAVLEGEQREHAHRRFLDAINASDVERNGKGELAVHGDTYVYWTSAIASGQA